MMMTYTSIDIGSVFILPFLTNKEEVFTLSYYHIDITFPSAVIQNCFTLIIFEI